MIPKELLNIKLEDYRNVFARVFKEYLPKEEKEYNPDSPEHERDIKENT